MSMNKIDITEYENYMESLVGWRGTIKELMEMLSHHFGKELKYENTTEEDKEYDYMLTFNIFGDDEDMDGEEWTDNWQYIDCDVYYLKMRQRNHIYITEVNVEAY